MTLELVLALTLAATASATDSPVAETQAAESSDASPLIAKIERAVVVGSVDALEKARGELQPRVAGDGALAEQRYLLAYVDWRLAQLMMAEPEKLEKERQEILEEAQQHLEILLKGCPEARAVQMGCEGVLEGDAVVARHESGAGIGEHLDQVGGSGPVGIAKGHAERFGKTGDGG